MQMEHQSGSRLRSLSAIFFLVCLFTSQFVQPARILSVAFVSSKSHKITYEPLLYELAARGHNVTVLAPYISGKTIKNLHEIQTIDVDEAFKNMPNTFEMREKDEDSSFAIIYQYAQICSDTYDLPQVQAVAKEKFDLIILQPMFNECTAAWIHAFNTSLVLVVPNFPPPWISKEFGNPNPYSFTPNFMSGLLSDEMYFLERVWNFVCHLLMDVMMDLTYHSTMEAVWKEKMPNSQLRSSDELWRNASLMLTNSHFSLLSYPRPYLPDIIEVGGMHCRPAKPLPKDLDDYLNSSGPDGFIYFSLGSALKGSMMPEEKRKIFLNVFSKLKQKVLWKWETEEMNDLPKNVKLSKWLPQQDVLGHPKIKAFITHGGLGGLTEAIYHGVPLVGIPMFGDQERNMLKAEHAGFAINLEYPSLSEGLTAAIQEILKPKYKERVQKLSTRFRDQPEKPLDRAVFWTEYVIRHKGATHLRSAARKLNFIQYHSIDVIAALLAVLGTVLYIIFATLRWGVRKFCGGGGVSAKAKAVKNGEKKYN